MWIKNEPLDGENSLRIYLVLLTASRGLPTCVQLLLAETGDFWRGSAMANLRFGKAVAFTLSLLHISTQG